MMKRYCVTNKSIVYLFKEIIIDTIILFLGIGGLYYYIGEDVSFFIFISLLFLLTYLCIMLIPVLYLYEKYMIYNDKLELILYNDKIKYNEEMILLSEIKKIIIVGTYQLFNKNDGGIGTLAYSPYFYYIEIVTDKKKYILTSLLGFSLEEDLRKTYPHLKYENVIKWFPTIS